MDINEYIFHILNGLAGRSFLFDGLVSLVLGNNLVKAAIIGSCFFAAWHAKETASDALRVRKILLGTLIASVLTLLTTSLISHSIFLPRPIEQSQRLYQFDGDSLVEHKRIAVRVPLDDSSQKKYRALLNGEIEASDLGSFPSDHAGFFVALSLGLFLAHRSVGLIALVWTFCFILAGKVIAGHHTPLDIGAGAAVGATCLLLCQYGASRGPGGLLDRMSRWSLNHSGVSSALIFGVLFEISSSFEHLRPIAKLLVTVGKSTLGVVQ